MGEKKEKKNKVQGKPDEEGSETLLESVDQELQMHFKEEKKEKEKEIEELQKKLEEKEKEVKEHYERLLRVAADLDNYKKRAAKEKEDWVKFANEDLMKAILPFIDNLERAITHAEKVEDAGVLIEGVRLTVQQLLKSLAKFGLSQFESQGKLFDPTVHEAVLVIPTDQHEPNQVIEEFQKGYFFNDRLLRPATVSVSKPVGKEAQATE
jgi:molecular chaperone GrpE